MANARLKFFVMTLRRTADFYEFLRAETTCLSKMKADQNPSNGAIPLPSMHS
jgi:hypothetical protein